MNNIIPQIPHLNIHDTSEKISFKGFKCERKAVLILGNGFDLCAGLKTSFSSFAHSPFWPLTEYYPNDSLAYHLNQKKQLPTWFDLEQEFYLYAHKEYSNVNTNNLDIDKKAFADIHNALCEYLNDQIEKYSPSSELPNIIIDFFQCLPGKNKMIFTFNYTSPASIIEKTGGKLKIPVRYVHGSLANRNIVLGVGDHNELHKKYHFLYKAMSPHYMSSDIVSELEAADDVIIFGHSMGINDYDYFNNFFLKACETRNGFQNDLRITIFTKSDDEKVTIKTRVRELSDKKLQRLINMCKFNIISTDNIYNVTNFIENYLKEHE